MGAGIAGLTAAIALDRAGITVEVYERATALAQSGTALSLWPNALAALDCIGLTDAIASIGVAEPTGTVRDPSGHLILRVDQSRLNRNSPSPTLIVHRGDLYVTLLAAARDLPIRMNTPAKGLNTLAGMGVVELTEGTTHRAPVVLACDGIHSLSRGIADNPPLAYRGRTSWRAVLSESSDLVSEATLTVGRGMQFIFGPMLGGRTYWAADIGLPEGANEKMVNRKQYLLGRFADWHAPIPELIERTDEDQLVVADLYDSIPRTLRAGQVGLLGDAAHPMTPDLGQGACQAIEDAVVMAACLGQGHDPIEALANYEAARLDRVQMIVRGSRRIGMVATTRSTVVAGIRDVAVRRMPPWLNSRWTARYASEASFLRTLPAGARA